MAERAEIKFVKLAEPTSGSAVLLTDENLRLAPISAALAKKAGDAFARAAKTSKFEGKGMKTLPLLAPAGVELDRLVFVGLGELKKPTPQDWLKLGGIIAGSIGGESEATVLLEKASGKAITAEDAANIGLGIALRSYTFDRYKTKKKKDNNDEGPKPRQYSIGVADPRAAQRAWSAASAVADGVVLARDLVNEPANALGPVEFAAELKKLADLGVEVTILAEPDLRKLKMGALLGVAQGSERPPRVVVMHWRGGKAKEQPVAFVGKGVVFDTGGISIKPAAGMEDMKGDMGGAAAVSGLMRALAGRKARVNAVGIVGLVENMPDGKAQRPGDIVTSMSGQTIEVINTDAEGRLVLADLLTYVQRNDKPVAIVNLATLTGAILVALGNLHAGMFSNNDALSEALSKAGQASGEKVWRLPLGPEYDKLIDSKFADMKNVGGRHAGSITAAQFLQRFIENDTPWAHLDVAGTAMGSPSSDTNRSWGSGWGVLLLDELVRERYEAKRS
jgi:leucyl aminopeptidase